MMRASICWEVCVRKGAGDLPRTRDNFGTAAARRALHSLVHHKLLMQMGEGGRGEARRSRLLTPARFRSSQMFYPFGDLGLSRRVRVALLNVRLSLKPANRVNQ